MAPPNNDDNHKTDKIHYSVRDPWAWVMAHVASESRTVMVEQSNPSMLPSGVFKAKAASMATPNTHRRRSSLKKGQPQPCTLRIDVQNGEGELIYAAHGTSAAFDGLEDKDELVRTLQRCRVEHLNLSPPSILIKWDVTRDECQRYVPQLPQLPGSHRSQDEIIAVLKEPMGSSGDGIYFVKSADETYEIMEKHRQQVLQDDAYLDHILDKKGRMPSWVLQAEVYPPLLVQDSRKFHIRSYVAVLEKLFDEDLLEVFCFNRHEVRIAAQSVDTENPDERSREAHITNGSLSTSNERVLLHRVPELVSKRGAIELFCTQTFKHLLPDLKRRVGYSASHEDPPPEGQVSIRKFSLAALDIMVTEEGRLYLLEVNVHPAAPPEDSVQGEFKQHLVGLMTDLVNLAMGKRDTNFLPSEDILKAHGQS